MLARALGPALLAFCTIYLSTVPAAASTAGEIVLAGARPNTVYVAQPQAQSLLLLRGGTVMASQNLAGSPGALALDPRRGLLYVALKGSGEIDIFQGATLNPVLALHAVATTRLSAVPGRDALYLTDPSTRHTLYLTYTKRGAVHIADLTAPVLRKEAQRRAARRRAVARARALTAQRNALHVTVHVVTPSGRRAPATWRGTFWAPGFAPDETVAVSWGAHNQGTVQADRFGIVGGSLPLVTGTAGAYSVGLYGLTSHHYLAQAVSPPAPNAHAPARKKLPPLYLGMLPGPITTLQPPLLHRQMRVPMSAGVLPVAPLVALVGLLKARGRRKKRRKAAPARRR